MWLIPVLLIWQLYGSWDPHTARTMPPVSSPYPQSSLNHCLDLLTPVHGLWGNWTGAYPSIRRTSPSHGHQTSFRTKAVLVMWLNCLNNSSCNMFSLTLAAVKESASTLGVKCMWLKQERTEDLQLSSWAVNGLAANCIRELIPQAAHCMIA